MRRSRPRYPKPQEVAVAKLALEHNIPMDGPMQMGMRESQKLVPNWRFAGTTGSVEWIVDVYCGGYYFVSVGRFSESVHSLMAVIRFVRLHLAARNARVEKIGD